MTESLNVCSAEKLWLCSAAPFSDPENRLTRLHPALTLWHAGFILSSCLSGTFPLSMELTKPALLQQCRGDWVRVDFSSLLSRKQVSLLHKNFWSSDSWLQGKFLVYITAVIYHWTPGGGLDFDTVKCRKPLKLSNRIPPEWSEQPKNRGESGPVGPH